MMTYSPPTTLQDYLSQSFETAATMMERQFQAVHDELASQRGLFTEIHDKLVALEATLKTLSATGQLAED